MFSRSFLIPAVLALTAAVAVPAQAQQNGNGNNNSGRSERSTERSSGPSDRGDKVWKGNCVTHVCRPNRRPDPPKKRLVVDSDRCDAWTAIRRVEAYGVYDPAFGEIDAATFNLIGARNGRLVRVEVIRRSPDCDIRRVVRYRG